MMFNAFLLLWNIIYNTFTYHFQSNLIKTNIWLFLITNLVLEVDLPDISSTTTSTGKSLGYCNGVGNAIIDYVELKMGGTTIDRQTREWMDIWSSLAIPFGKQTNYKRSIST